LELLLFFLNNLESVERRQLIFCFVLLPTLLLLGLCRLGRRHHLPLSAGDDKIICGSADCVELLCVDIQR
jgi:hypothetical protein